MPGASHLRHGGETELVEVVQDVMVEVGGDSPQAGNVQPLVTAGQLNQPKCGREGRDGFYHEGDLKKSKHLQIFPFHLCSQTGILTDCWSRDRSHSYPTDMKDTIYTIYII